MADAAPLSDNELQAISRVFGRQIFTRRLLATIDAKDAEIARLRDEMHTAATALMLLRQTVAHPGCRWEPGHVESAASQIERCLRRALDGEKEPTDG